MVHRSKWLPWLACVVVAAIGFPALAQGESESADPPSTGSSCLAAIGSTRKSRKALKNVATA